MQFIGEQNARKALETVLNHTATTAQKELSYAAEIMNKLSDENLAMHLQLQVSREGLRGAAEVLAQTEDEIEELSFELSRMRREFVVEIQLHALARQKLHEIKNQIS